MNAQDGILGRHMSLKLILVQAPMGAEWLDLVPSLCNSGTACACSGPTNAPYSTGNFDDQFVTVAQYFRM